MGTHADEKHAVTLTEVQRRLLLPWQCLSFVLSLSCAYIDSRACSRDALGRIRAIGSLWCGCALCASRHGTDTGVFVLSHLACCCVDVSSVVHRPRNVWRWSLRVAQAVLCCKAAQNNHFFLFTSLLAIFARSCGRVLFVTELVTPLCWLDIFTGGRFTSVVHLMEWRSI